MFHKCSRVDTRSNCSKRSNLRIIRFKCSLYTYSRMYAFEPIQCLCVCVCVPYIHIHSGCSHVTFSNVTKRRFYSIQWINPWTKLLRSLNVRSNPSAFSINRLKRQWNRVDKKKYLVLFVRSYMYIVSTLLFSFGFVFVWFCFPFLAVFESLLD